MASPLSMIETLKDSVARFEDLKIDYMVTGSFAMSIYLPPRTTYDIDVVIEIEADKTQQFVKRFSPDYYVESNSVNRAIATGSMFNIISNTNGVKVDCIIRKDSEFEREKFRRKQTAELEGIEFWVATKEDLMLSKLQWARDSLSEMQISDIVRLSETGYDTAYVEVWLELLNLGDVWNEVDEWKTQAGK